MLRVLSAMVSRLLHLDMEVAERWEFSFIIREPLLLTVLVVLVVEVVKVDLSSSPLLLSLLDDAFRRKLERL
jgi:hypothetical protein